MQSKIFILYVILSAQIGCMTDNPCNTFGLRIFNEYPRSKNDNTWISVLEKSTGDSLFKGPLYNGGHRPIEIHSLPSRQEIIFKIQYLYFDKDSINGTYEIFEKTITLNNNVDIRVYWSDISEDRKEIYDYFLEQKPDIEVSHGHLPLF